MGGYQLVFYSGANGKVCKTVPLSGALDDEGCGVGALWFPVPGIQNGPADGIALVKDGLEVLQFLSYEGSLTASNGAATGLTSVPVAVSEPVSTAAGWSLQLAGTGDPDADFIWSGPAPASPGSLNAGQIFSCGGEPSAPRFTSPASMIHLIGINKVSDAMEVTLASTNNAGSFPADLFSCDPGGTNGNFQGFASRWSLAAANLVLVGTNPVTFADTGQLGRLPPAAAPLRIYAAARSDVDTDADGLSDGAELFVFHTEPAVADTDGDGLSDGDEVNDSGTSPRNRDSDGDELTDGEEVFVYGTNPLSSDTDSDGMTDGWEIANGFDPLEPSDGEGDADGDGLSNSAEQQAGTDPRMADTDGDGIGDSEDSATGNCSLGGMVLNYTLPAHWEVCYIGNTGYPVYIATVEAHPTGFVGNVEAITNIVLSGWVDDCFKINGHEYAWTPGNKEFGENITDQVSDKITGQFSVEVYDYISNVNVNLAMMTSDRNSSTVGASCLIQYRIALVVNLSVAQDWECWSSNGTYQAGAHLTTDSYTDGRVTWSLAAIAGSAASISDHGVVTFGAGGGRYRIRASAVDLGTCYDSTMLVVPKVDIRQTETNVCQNCECSVTLDVTDSYSPGGYVWSSSPAGISGRGPSVTFNPGDIPPGTYTVYAKSASHPECLDTCTVNVIKVESIDGYVYGESGRKIEHMEALPDPANVVASGYMKFKATILPSSISDTLYYKWTATAGTLTNPEGTGNGFLEVKWDAPDGHEQDVTLTLEVKPSASGAAICTEIVELRTIRPYVVRVKFVDDFWNEEQQIADNGSETDPEFDATTGKSGPVCYVMHRGMQTQVDIAGEKDDDSVNNLKKKTPIKLSAKAAYGGIENQFDEDSMDDNTENWSAEDYSTVEIESADNVPEKVTEYEDFEMHWTFKVKNSSGSWITAYEEETGYSQKTVHKETAGGKTYGLYLTYDVHQFDDDADFKKLILDYACNWADGKNTPNDIRNDIISNGFGTYVYDYNCHILSASFVRACLTVGLEAKQHVWTRPQSWLAGMGALAELYDGPNATWSDDDTYLMKSYPIGGTAYEWTFHAWAESDSVIYDPSAEAAGGDGTPSSGSWGAYEDDCFDDYRYITDASATPMALSGWVDNPAGHSSGFNDEGDHVFHYEYDDSTAGFPEFLEP